MIVKVNGENISVEKSLNISDLLIAVKAEQPEYVTVQLNGEFVERDDGRRSTWQASQMNNSNATAVT